MTIHEVHRFIELLKEKHSSFFAVELLANVKTFLDAQESTVAKADTIIFPECGCGFFEWSIVLMVHKMKLSLLRQPVNPLQRVVLMDVNIPSHAPPVWRQIAAILDTELHVFASYRTLDSKVQSSPEIITATAMVIYCNGAMRFGQNYCAPDETPLEILQAALSFWHWCDKHAANGPVNFVMYSTFGPADKVTWKQLADINLHYAQGTSRCQWETARWWDRLVHILRVWLLDACPLWH
jgi:hypothetical protein